MKESDSEFFTKAEFTYADGFTDIRKVYSSAGGYTEVYEARRALKRFALKTLKPELASDPLYTGLLRKEFESGYRLDHPGIVRTYSFEHVDGLGDCIVMEWVDGVTLEEAAGRRLYDDKVWQRIILEICDALEYLEARQIVHRDLKPSNVMLTTDGAHAKLMDFGFSDSPEYAALKHSGGTKEYAAPEQLAAGGEPITHLSDIYALGRLLQTLPMAKSRRLRKIERELTAPSPSGRPEDMRTVKRRIAGSFRRPSTIWYLLSALIVILLAVAVPLLITNRSKDVTVTTVPAETVPAPVAVVDNAPTPDAAVATPAETTSVKEETPEAVDFNQIFPEKEDDIDQLKGGYSGGGYIFSEDYPILMEMEIKGNGMVYARYKSPGDYLWTNMTGKVRDRHIGLMTELDPETDFVMQMTFDYLLDDWRLELTGYAMGSDDIPTEASIVLARQP